MKLSTTIEMVWQLAGQEAIAGQFQEIEPEHIFAAILKLSELPVEEVDKIVPEAEVAMQLAAEVKTIRQELTGRSIDSTTVRRSLREKLGKGNVKYEGGAMHRSQASRNLFDNAAKHANAQESEILTAGHLLQALLCSPTPRMIEVLGKVPEKKWASPKIPKLIADGGGTDITRLAREGHLPMVADRKAECRAVLSLLAKDKPRCLFLIAEREEIFLSVIHAIAQMAVSDECPPRFKNKSLILLNGDTGTDALLDGIIDALDDAFSFENLVMCIASFGKIIDAGVAEKCAHSFKALLEKPSGPCICFVGESFHRKWIKEDSFWRQYSRTLYITADPLRQIPAEL